MNKKSTTEREYRVRPDSGWAGAWKISAGIGAVGFAAAAFGYVQDPTRFAFSYLFAFFLFLTMGLGALFFVLIQYLTKAGWSVTVRRTAEFFMKGLWIFAILCLPIIPTMGRLFPWLEESHASESQAPINESVTKESGAQPVAADLAGRAKRPAAFREEGNEALDKALEQRLERQKELAEERTLEGKKPYLNKTFFLIRLVGYLAVWIFLSYKLFDWSTDQDKSKRVANTAAAQRFAPAGIMLFAVTITFAAFDWLMSLQPTWYSTIFGVYVFAGCVVVNMALLILVTWMLKRSGAVGNAINVEHFHDMGKLLFGWLVFWAYISFAQFFLIWYANIPEELVFFHRRWTDGGGTWKNISLALVIFHFAIPFWLLMSRNVKRRVEILITGAVTLVVMHVVEIYWLVMPNYPGNDVDPAHQFVFAPHWLDLACLVGVGGVYFAVVLHTLAGYPLIPIGDPRLGRALKFENA